MQTLLPKAVFEGLQEPSADNEHRESVKKHRENLAKAICTVKKLRTMEVPPKRKVIDDWFREGDIGFIFALRGVGKTWFAFDLARSIADGAAFGPWGCHFSAPVLYVDGEVSANDMKGRAKGIGIESANLHYLNHELLFEHGHSTIDVADLDWQEAITGLCEDLKIKVIILDNLSCLAPTVDENEGVEWSDQLLNWVLGFRRRAMSVIFVQHANRTGENMRGHSRREDPANWIIQLSQAWKSGEDKFGAKFVSRFKKNRNASQWPLNYEFWYKPDGDGTVISIKKAEDYDVFIDLLADGLDSNKEIAEAMGLKAYEVTRLANLGERKGEIFRAKGNKYKLSTATYE